MATLATTAAVLASLRHSLCVNCIGYSVAARKMSAAPQPRRDREGNVVRRQPKLWVQKQKAAKRDAILTRQTRKIVLPDMCTPKSLASLLGVRAVDVLKIMIKMGENPRSADESLRTDLASLIATELNYEPTERAKTIDKAPRVLPEDLSEFPRRPPMVTVIGHIDHGKTTLLDTLRNAKVAASEAGQITQHIGAFTVKMTEGDAAGGTNVITFMDTPGHEAFTSLRERGVRKTDIALLVVAADDGVQEQTIEAIRVAKEAGVQIMVCITKIDKLSDGDTVADTSQLRDQLYQQGVEVEGMRPGHTGVPCIQVSAKTGRGMEELKAAIVLQAELMDLRAPVDGPAEGVVLESRMEKGRGPLATVLVTVGTMYEDDDIVVGLMSGKIKFMRDHRGRDIKEAGPGIPIEIIGLKEVPPPGTQVFCVESKEEAEQVVEYRSAKNNQNIATAQREVQQKEEQELRQEAMSALTAETGKTHFDRTTIQQKINQLQKARDNSQDKSGINIVLKTDVAGSIEGVQKALSVLPQDEVALRIVRTGVGPIVEGDVAAARTTGSYLVAFNVKANPILQEIARKREVKIIEHRVVYNIVNAVSELMSALLPPSILVDVLGAAQVKEVFEVNKGTKAAVSVAGCMVIDGIIRRGAPVQVLRGEKVIHEAKVDTLKSFKAAAPEVRKGNECGISLPNFNEFRSGDIIRCVNKRQVARKLGEKRIIN